MAKKVKTERQCMNQKCVLKDDFAGRRCYKSEYDEGIGYVFINDVKEIVKCPKWR
jgi:hypothetical protein